MPDEEPYGGYPWPYALTKFQVEELMHAYASEVRAAKHTPKHTPPTPSTLQAKAHAKPTPTPTLSLWQDEELQQEAHMDALPHLDLLVIRIGSCLTDPPGTPTYLELTTLTLTPTLTPNPNPNPNPNRSTAARRSLATPPVQSSYP